MYHAPSSHKVVNLFTNHAIKILFILRVRFLYSILQLQVNPYEHTLKCYTSTVGDNPLLMLQPVKVEELYHNPDLVQFHNVVSDNEIELIQNLSTPMVSSLIAELI